MTDAATRACALVGVGACCALGVVASTADAGAPKPSTPALAKTPVDTPVATPEHDPLDDLPVISITPTGTPPPDFDDGPDDPATTVATPAATETAVAAPVTTPEAVTAEPSAAPVATAVDTAAATPTTATVDAQQTPEPAQPTPPETVAPVETVAVPVVPEPAQGVSEPSPPPAAPLERAAQEASKAPRHAKVHRRQARPQTKRHVFSTRGRTSLPPAPLHGSQPTRVVAVRTRGGGARLGARTYLIQPGDTLSEIAARYGLSWQHLAVLNDLRDPDLIYAGDTLILE